MSEQSGGLGKRRRRVFGGRPHKVSVRLTAEEFAAVSALAAARRLSVPALMVVQTLSTREGGGVDPEAERSLLVEVFAIRRNFGKLAANINSIARYAQGSGEVSPTAAVALASVETMNARLEEFLVRLKEFFPGIDVTR